MKYRVIFWLFSFCCFVILLKGGEQKKHVQIIGSTCIVSNTLINSFVNYKTAERQTMVFTKSTIKLPVPDFYTDGSTLLTATDRRTHSSLLVVERWESSPLIDNCSPSSRAGSSVEESLSNAEKLALDDYLTLLHMTSAGRQR